MTLDPPRFGCYTWSMPERSSKRKKKRPTDINRLAKSIVDDATRATGDDVNEKNPAAVELGRLGGLKGGKARASKLSAARRREIAIKAAKARWSKHSRGRDGKDETGKS